MPTNRANPLTLWRQYVSKTVKALERSLTSYHSVCRKICWQQISKSSDEIRLVNKTHHFTWHSRSKEFFMWSMYIEIYLCNRIGRREGWGCWGDGLTSWDPHTKHLWSSTSSGVWQYLHTGQLQQRGKNKIMCLLKYTIWKNIGTLIKTFIFIAHS